MSSLNVHVVPRSWEISERLRRLPVPELAWPWNDPHVLDRAATQHPPEVQLSASSCRLSPLVSTRPGDIPGPDELAEQHELRIILRCGAAGVESVDQSRGRLVGVAVHRASKGLRSFGSISHASNASSASSHLRDTAAEGWPHVRWQASTSQPLA